jgi:hypothetical protein
MVEFFRAGGMPIWMVTLFGVITLVAAILFARRPDERRMAFIRAMTTATVLNIIGGVASCVGMVFYRVSTVPELAKPGEVHLVVMMGLAESLTPAILGFTLLSLVWLITAIGVRRLAHRLQAA